MRTIMVLARVMVLLGLFGMTLTACGATETAAPTKTISGPALLFFYTDN
jgi:hypothetical protein